MNISVVVLAMGVQDALGMVFGVCIIALSFFLVHRWVLKPERELRRKQAQLGIEEIHRKHWENRRRNSEAE